MAERLKKIMAFMTATCLFFAAAWVGNATASAYSEDIGRIVQQISLRAENFIDRIGRLVWGERDKN